MRFRSHTQYVTQYLLFFFMFMTMMTAHAQLKTGPITLELQNTDLVDAIHMVAKFLHRDVMISPTVSGMVTLNLQHTAADQAMALLLSANGLAARRMGKVWMIASQNELLKQKEAEAKWQAYQSNTMPLLTRVWQIHYARADDIAHLVQGGPSGTLLSKRGWLQVDTRTNRICVRDSSEPIQTIRDIIDHVDVPVQQVSIAARLVSIDNDVERELGLQFSTRAAGAEEKQDGNGISSSQNAGHFSLAVAKLADASLLDIKLSALESDGRAELISSPSLFTANQQTASIEAGEEVPYQETSDSGGTAVVFKKAVLGLKVTPHVLPGKMVLLQLQINQDRPSNKMVLGVPTISTRQMITSVLVKSGQTMVLGGVYETNEESGHQAVPWLHKIPLLGWLFKQFVIRENKRELLIFICPKIVVQSHENRTR